MRDSPNDTDQSVVGDGGERSASVDATTDPDIDDLLEHLDELHRTVDERHERETVSKTIDLVERMPGSRAFTRRVKYYTSRDVAESFVGGILFSLPLLVEDGVFEIAEWFGEVRVGGIPVFLVLNLLFIGTVTYGILYATDFRDVQRHRPIFGLIPRRFLGVMIVSFIVAFGLMYMWGRLAEEDPTTLEAFARVTVIWAAAAFGAVLGDILPGESSGTDINDFFE